MSLQGPKTLGLELEPAAPLALGGAIAASYAYYPGGALAAASDAGGAASYAYDEAGDLTDESATPAGEADTASTTYAYDEANRLESTTFDPGDGSTPVTTLYGFDTANAWRTSQGPQADPGARPVQMAYNAQGRMSAYADADANTSASYTYDGAGQRTQSEVTVAGVTTTTSFAYEDLSLMYLSAVQGATSWRIDYLHDEEGLPFGGVYRSPASSTSPVYFSLITSDRGDTLELCDSGGSAFCAYRYDAWGLPQGEGSFATGVWTQGTTLVNSTLAGQIATRQVLRYASYVFDAESALYYCSARFYDPATRQWTTGDPAKADGEESAYQYCGGNPARGIDPSGEHEKWLPITNPRHPFFHKTPRQRIYYAAWHWCRGVSRDTVLNWCERGGDTEAWCCDAVSYICNRAKSEPFMGRRAWVKGFASSEGRGFDSVDKLVLAAKATWRGLKWWPNKTKRYKARRGDIIVYNWPAYQDEEGWHYVGPDDHVGIVISMRERKTIEGNRSSFKALESIRVGTNRVNVWRNQVYGFVHPSH